MEKYRTVTFIGSGKLATQMAPALDNAGYGISEVYSKQINNAQRLVELLYQAEAVDSMDFSNSPSGIFILAISDDAIEEVSNLIQLPPEAVLVHTSGSVPLEVLGAAATPNIGVLYPLQTFSENGINFETTPLFVEAGTEQANVVITGMAKAISNSVHRLDSVQRRALHLAAVFASNFTNHMLTISKDVMDQHRLDYSWLNHLVLETIRRGLNNEPQSVQTGPACRGDLKTLDLHLTMLEHNPQIAEIYQLISQHIIDLHGE